MQLTCVYMMCSGIEVGTEISVCFCINKHVTSSGKMCRLLHIREYIDCGTACRTMMIVIQIICNHTQPKALWWSYDIVLLTAAVEG